MYKVASGVGREAIGELNSLDLSSPKLIWLLLLFSVYLTKSRDQYWAINMAPVAGDDS